MVSGSALLVDYVLTITISIAAVGDALPTEVGLIAVLTVLNPRGVKESVVVALPAWDICRS